MTTDSTDEIIQKAIARGWDGAARRPGIFWYMGQDWMAQDRQIRISMRQSRFMRQNPDWNSIVYARAQKPTLDEVKAYCRNAIVKMTMIM